MKLTTRTARSGIALFCALGAFSIAPAAFAAPAATPAATQDGPDGVPVPDSDPGTRLTPDSAPAAGADRGLRRKAGRVKLRLSPGTARYGSKVKVSGNSGVRGRTRVRLLFRRNGSSRWHRLKTITSSRKGRYRAGIKATGAGRIRVEVRGNDDSAVKRLSVRSRLSVGSVHRFVKVGDRNRIGGTIRPRGVRRITVTITGAGRKVIRTRSDRRGRFSVKWSPGRSGNYRARVSAAPNRIAAGDRSRRIRLIGLRPTHASYFGPGLYGGALACGGSLSPGTRGVAHKTLPCGSKVTLRYGNRSVKTRVVDRGPYIAGREFDLTTATRNDLGFGDIGTVWTNR